MPRVPRFVVPGLPHHITQRGNYRQPIFFNDADRQFFLRRLTKRAKQYEIDVLAWCLMINHFHLIAIPRRRDSFALGLRALLAEYSLRINAQREEVRGHLWQSRFYSCALSQRHLRMALRYVELNPVRANLVDDPEQYPWSSARSHLGLALPLGMGHAQGLCGRMNGVRGCKPEPRGRKKINCASAPFRDGFLGRRLPSAAAPEKRDGA